MSEQRSPEPAWATKNSKVDLRAPGNELRSELVADRLSIADTVARYSWAYDERRIDILSRCFTEDARFHGSVAGEVEFGPYEGSEAITQWLKSIWESQSDQRRHCVMNLVIDDLGSHSATASAFVLISAAENGAVRLATTGIYRFAMKKDAEGWRIATMFVGLDVGF